VPVLFALTLLTSAAVLFLVQPMMGKRVLPLFGGSPAVWNTCMVFFQAMLLCGYYYAHKLSQVRSQARQVLIHGLVLLAACTVLAASALFTSNHTTVPILESLVPTEESFPFFHVLATLFVGVGVPFFAISTSAPLLQRWFTATGHSSAKDPYFLYAASNLGSLLSLLGYPLLTEPLLTLSQQSWLFAGGLVLMTGLTLLCGRAALRPLKPPGLMESQEAASFIAEPTGGQKTRWVMLAAIPSSLMLGITTYLTTDIAAIPLLWIVPLALYLVTFIVAFSNAGRWLRLPVRYIGPLLLLLLIFGMTSGVVNSIVMLIGLHLAAYFFLALMLHIELAQARPPARQLTQFYLWVSVGGVLGGLFNSLIAPLLFSWSIEYALALVLACFFLPKLHAPVVAPTGDEPDPKAGWSIFIDLLTLPSTVLLVYWLSWCSVQARDSNVQWARDFGVRVTQQLNNAVSFVGLTWNIERWTVEALLYFAPPCLLAFFSIERPHRFALKIGAILFVMYYTSLANISLLISTRSFFGVLQIRSETATVWHASIVKQFPSNVLSHGTTVHGRQFREGEGLPSDIDPDTPLTYYHRDGPVGDLFRETFAAKPKGSTIGMVGLGAGSVSAYIGADRALTFYEIDPKMVKLVEEPNYFGYVDSARRRGGKIDIVLGDARLTLAKEPAKKFDLLMIDAFSSDAIPIHLMTEEALAMYVDKLSDDGLLAFHISNRYLSLDPVLAAMAQKLGLSCRICSDRCEFWGSVHPLPHVKPGRTSTVWVVLAKSESRMERFEDPKLLAPAAIIGGAAFGEESRWTRIDIPEGMKGWTDDYADVMSVFFAPEVQWLRRKLGLSTLNPP